MAFVAYNPLAGGMLSGKYPAPPLLLKDGKLKEDATTFEAPIPEVGRFSNTFAVQGALYRDRFQTAAHFRAVEIVRTAAQKKGLSLVEVALRWLVHHSALKVKEK